MILGLELTIKGKTIAAAVEKGVSSIIVTQRITDDSNEISLDFSGLRVHSENLREPVMWYGDTLKEGDELIIRVKKIDNPDASI